MYVCVCVLYTYECVLYICILIYVYKIYTT